MHILEGGDAEITILNESIIKYNLSHIPFPRNPPWTCICFVIKEEEKLIGGIYGHLIMDNILSIDVLFVDKDYRSCGHGSNLIRRIEIEAKNKGAYLAQLDTFDFQGLDFYKKLGYTVFGTLDDCPSPGHQRFYLKKKL
jgi:GNAT superfamily N-acetyltransferase